VESEEITGCLAGSAPGFQSSPSANLTYPRDNFIIISAQLQKQNRRFRKGSAVFCIYLVTLSL